MWNFSFASDTYLVPVGVGIGKVWLVYEAATINAFVEPQFTVAADGAGQQSFKTLPA